MSGRREAMRQESKAKIATKYLDWDSDNACFKYYEKKEGEEKGSNVLEPLPFKFLILGKPYATIKGFHEPSNTGIYSNEILMENINKESLTVKTFAKQNNVIASGLWKDIKDDVAKADGKFTTSIYAMDVNGKLVNLQIKGIALKAWMEFSNLPRFNDRKLDEWVCVSDFIKGKKGKVEFTEPVFSFVGSVSKEEDEQAENAWNRLKLGLEDRLTSRNSESESESESNEDDYSDVEKAEFG